MTGHLDLLNSERGVFSIVLVVLATVLVILGFITADAWLTYTKWISVTLIASKTVTSAIEQMKKPATGKPDPGEIPSVPPS